MRHSPTIAKNDEAWRTPGHGLRDILSLLESDVGKELVETAVPALVEHWLLGSSRPGGTDAGPITLALQHLHGGKPEDLRAILNGEVHDLSGLSDETLLGPLVVPDACQVASQSEMGTTNSITAELAQHLGLIPGQLMRDLRRLQASDPEIWSLVTGGRLGTAARVRRAFNGFTAKESDQIIRAQALDLFIMTIRMRAALIRRWSTRPMTDTIRYETQWQYQGRLMMTAIVSPAQQIETVLNIAAGRPEAGRLAGSFLENSNIVALAEAVQRRMPMLAGKRSYPEAERIMRERVAAALGQLTPLTGAKRAAEGLGMRDFVSARLDVPASHCIVVLAAMLLDAKRQIDICLRHAKAGRVIPKEFRTSFCRVGVSRRKLARTTRWLRHAERTDRHAHSIGNGSHDDKAGHKMVESALAAFGKAYPTTAVATMRVDPRGWFEQ